MLDFWLPVVGLGMVFQGGLILWVAGFPQVLTGRLPKAEPGSAEAFGIFWIEQYRFIGLTLLLLGVLIAALGLW